MVVVEVTAVLLVVGVVVSVFAVVVAATDATGELVAVAPSRPRGGVHAWRGR